MATTRLHLAAGKGDMAGAQACLQAGDPIDQPDQHGNAALHLAAKGGHGTLIQMLAGARANVNLQATTTGATPLVFAAMNGHAAAVQQLLGFGAQPGLATRKGKTALFNPTPTPTPTLPYPYPYPYSYPHPHRYPYPYS